MTNDPSPAAIRCPIDGEPAVPAYDSAGMRMYRCTSCGTAFAHPVPEAEFLARYYTEFHQGEGKTAGYSQEAKMVRKHHSQLALVRRTTGGVIGRLLDVGCGKGFFLQIAQKQGVMCEGTELSDTGVEYARDRLGVKATHGTIESLKDVFGPASFDTVTLWGVIEHLPNPMQTLRAIHHVLKPGGWFLAQTGAGDDWLDRLLPGVNQWYDPPMHLFVFSARGLSRAMTSAGFGEVSVDGWYDITLGRRWLRLLRNGAAAASLRMVFEGFRLGSSGCAKIRFPLGSEMSAIGRKR